MMRGVSSLMGAMISSFVGFTSAWEAIVQLVQQDSIWLTIWVLFPTVISTQPLASFTMVTRDVASRSSGTGDTRALTHVPVLPALPAHSYWNDTLPAFLGLELPSSSSQSVSSPSEPVPRRRALLEASTWVPSLTSIDMVNSLVFSRNPMFVPLAIVGFVVGASVGTVVVGATLTVGMFKG